MNKHTDYSSKWGKTPLWKRFEHSTAVAESVDYSSIKEDEAETDVYSVDKIETTVEPSQTAPRPVERKPSFSEFRDEDTASFAEDISQMVNLSVEKMIRPDKKISKSSDTKGKSENIQVAKSQTSPGKALNPSQIKRLTWLLLGVIISIWLVAGIMAFV